MSALSTPQAGGGVAHEDVEHPGCLIEAVIWGRHLVAYKSKVIRYTHEAGGCRKSYQDRRRVYVITSKVSECLGCMILRQSHISTMCVMHVLVIRT